jgi:hypothetical protein
MRFNPFLLPRAACSPLAIYFPIRVSFFAHAKAKDCDTRQFIDQPNKSGLPLLRGKAWL